MNILFTAPAFFPHSFGGGEIYVYRLAGELLKQGHKLKVLTAVKWAKDKKSNESYEIQNYEHEDIPVISFSRNPDKISYVEKIIGHGPILIEILRKIITEESPELIHINGMKPALVMLCNEMQMPHVVTAHHTGIVCPAGGLVRHDWFICEEEINAHNCIPCCCFWKQSKWYVGGLMGRIPRWIYKPLGKKLLARNKLSYILRGLITPWLIEESMRQKKIVLEKAQLIIAPSQFMRKVLVKGGCNPDKIHVIPHGIKHIGRIPMEDIKDRPIRFGYIGRIDPSKGLHILLEATEFLRNGSSCEIHIFGAARNPWDEEYKKKTIRTYKGKTKIIDHGMIPHEKISEVYAEIDVVIVPSILPEAFGFVVAEAFSAGRPVIAFNSGALAEAVTEGQNGFIIEDNKSITLARYMQAIIDRPEIVIEMSEKIPAVKTIKEYIDDMEIIYRKIINC